ncbi:MAG: hypothetical protein ACQXXL_08250, partial [Candidatus Methanosuratincola sp.]
MEKSSRKIHLPLVLMAVLAISVIGVAFVSAKVSVDFKQYANDPANTDDKTWINSILQKGNSIYYENMLVPQRILFKDIDAVTGNNHTMYIEHQAMKGYIHAYDFLGSWEQATLVATDTTKGFGLDPSTGWDLWADQAKGFVKSSDAALYTSLVSGGNSYNVYCPDDLGTISIDPDGHSINDKISAWEAVYGNRYITIYGDSPITSAGLTFVGYTTSGGDAYAKYQLWWVSASKNVVIQFAGHLAVSGDGTGYTYGPGKGSASISGGPYHIYLSQLDGQSIGSQDNQIMGADILPPPGTPCISVTKTPSASKVLTGTNVAFTINVTNCGDVPLTMNVTDTYFGTIATNVPIAVDQSIIYTKYAVLTANHANTVDVTATSQSGATVSANATATVDVIHPAISV